MAAPGAVGHGTNRRMSITDVPGVTRNEALRMAGNGAVQQQARAALAHMLAAARQEAA